MWKGVLVLEQISGAFHGRELRDWQDFQGKEIQAWAEFRRLKVDGP
jgi:hypothetical protein